VVQLLLTFDPVLVEKVATLLCEVIRDNPNISTLYHTGVFYFILMYTGSNVLPVARFLQLTHTKQALKWSDVSGIVHVIVYRSYCSVTVIQVTLETDRCKKGKGKVIPLEARCGSQGG